MAPKLPFLGDKKPNKTRFTAVHFVLIFGTFRHKLNNKHVNMLYLLYSQLRTTMFVPHKTPGKDKYRERAARN